MSFLLLLLPGKANLASSAFQSGWTYISNSSGSLQGFSFFCLFTFGTGVELKTLCLLSRSHAAELLPWYRSFRLDEGCVHWSVLFWGFHLKLNSYWVLCSLCRWQLWNYPSFEPLSQSNKFLLIWHLYSIGSVPLDNPDQHRLTYRCSYEVSEYTNRRHRSISVGLLHIIRSQGRERKGTCYRDHLTTLVDLIAGHVGWGALSLRVEMTRFQKNENFK